MGHQCNQGETYIDFKFGDCAGISEDSFARFNQILTEIMAVLGWRTYTHEELRLMARADFNDRIRRRIEHWHMLPQFEARPVGMCGPNDFRCAELPFLIYDGEREWFEALTGEAAEATSVVFTQRLRALIASQKITQDEYNLLMGNLGWP